MSVLSEIYEGWKNFIFENPEVEAEAKRRMEICAGNDVDVQKCDFFSDRKSCKKCGCYMPAKVRSAKSKCPDKKW